MTEHVWEHGNATDDRDDKNWLVGQFVADTQSLTHTVDVEIKWADHAAGQQQSEWQSATGTSIGILISGDITVSFHDGSVNLTRPGDYVLWPPEVEHRWHTSAATRMLTVRWPSA